LRVLLLLLAAVVAFAGGLALGTWRGDRRDAPREPVATRLDGARPDARIRLLTADPGTLRRPATPSRPHAAPVAYAAPAAAPAPLPSAPSVPASRGVTPQPTFDSTGEEPTPSSPDFDLDG
jgi:hypothetical protein